ncbi:MAG: TonB-dependent receptor [Flavobacteriaceae bacterium]|nr:MAG: TonB-dependent receptor [Flavobacteriaceae bacterium]
MRKAHSKYIGFIVCLLFFLTFFSSKAQETPEASITLISYLQQLEKEYDVKFSYADEHIQSFMITNPKSEGLEGILKNIQDQTQLKIQKINDRYYSLFKSSTVDICGHVLDNYKNTLASGATIEVLNSEIALLTDFDGKFYLENIPRDALLRIRHLGYKTQYIAVEKLTNQHPCKTILMGLSYEQLDEVILFDFLTTGLSKQTDASIQLNTEDLGILPGLIEPDVLQTIQALPGIKSIDETVSDINVRGGTNDQNLILWDGIKMYQSGHFFGLISAFNPYLTDKVTVIKNGTSAQYGDGISSVISMETKNEIKNTFFGGAGFNLISGDVYGQLPISQDLAFQFSARRSTTDFFSTPTYNQFIDKAFQDSAIKIGDDPTSDRNISRNENFYFYDFTAKILYDITEYQKIRFSFININNNLDYLETIENNNTTESYLDQTNLSFGGSLESQWTRNFSTLLHIYYTQYNMNAEHVLENQIQQLSQKNEVLETAVKLNTTYTFSDQIQWLNGYQFNETGITNFTNVSLPEFNSNLKGVIRTHSAFSEFKYTSANEKLYARGGARLNYIENLNTFKTLIIEPRFNISYALTDNIKTEIQGEYKNQTTNQIIDLEQNFLGVEKRRWRLSDNDSIPITKSKQASIGVNYDKKRLYIGLEGFYKEVNGVSTVTQGFQNQNQFNGEIGKYDIVGAEFLINKKTLHYSTWLSYTYNVNNYTFEDIIPNRFPNNLDIRHHITFAGIYTYNNLKLGIGLNYRSGRPFTEPLNGDSAINTLDFPNTINYNEPNSDRLPTYIRADASATYNFDMGDSVKATVGASVINILDRRNLLNTYYRLNENNQIETVESISLGITPNFSFRVKF